MSHKFRTCVSISVLFIFAAAGLYFFDIKMKSGQHNNSFWFCELWSFCILFFVLMVVLYLFVQTFNANKTKTNDLQKKLTETENALNDAQESLDATVEKKTFEMSLVNGSLNREIAERIQAEAEGIKLRKRMHAILNSAGDGIFGIDLQGSVTFVNNKAAELLEYSTEELIGRSHHDLVHHTHFDGSVFPVQECPIYMAYKDGDIHHETDDIFWKKSGTSFHVEYTSTPLLDGNNLSGAVVVFKDISKKMKLKQQLELIVNSTGEGIFGLDIDGNVTFMNKAATIMLGWTQKELIGKSHHDLVHHTHADGSHYHEEDCPIYMAYKDGKVHFKSDDIFWTKDKTNFLVEYTSTPIFEGKQLSGAVVVFRDLNLFS